jgi:DNA helicase-2/ATP-dependent DNA helicase PcrA
MEDGLFPSLREREGVSEDAALEEERRLAYVAITRAREKLVLTHARTRRVWGEIRIQGPSRFLHDLPPSALAAPVRARSTTMPTGPRIVDGNFTKRSGWAQQAQRRAAQNEFDQSTSYDDEPVYRVDDDLTGRAGGFTIGGSVVHGTLGMGRVVSISGQGKDQKVVVDFGAIGQKTVFARYLQTSDYDLN